MTIRLNQNGNVNNIESGSSDTANSLADLRFTGISNGNILMTLSSTGNLGVGTTSPSQRLDVVGGSLRITGGSLLATHNSNTIGSLFTTGGNIGIGSTSPRELIEIAPLTGSTSGMMLYSGAVDSGVNRLVFHHHYDPTGYKKVQLQTKATGGFGRADFAICVNTEGSSNDATFADHKLFISGTNGNVGIGTSSPSSRLVVRGSTSTGILKLTNDSDNANDSWWLGFNHGGSNSADNHDRARIGVNIHTTGAGRLYFTTGAGGSQTERMRIDESGNVGIGNSAPIAALSLGSSSVSGSDSFITVAKNNGSGGARHFRLGMDSEFYFTIGDYGSNNVASTWIKSFKVWYGATENALVIGNAGNVGIGYSSPDQKLHIDTSGGAPGYNIHLSGNSNQTHLAYIGNLSDANNGGWGGSASMMYITSSFSNNRSINARGTLNASGADYAEYMTKSGDFEIAKGDICGVNAEGKLTNVFSQAVSFVVKSTDPCMVGGDVWGTEDKIGEKPMPPSGESTEEEQAAYETALAAWEATLESERQKVDRMSFCGQTPVNVYNATPGDYIIPIEKPDGSIGGIAVSKANLTSLQYQDAVGKVIKTLEDGRAYIIVKIL